MPVLPFAWRAAASNAGATTHLSRRATVPPRARFDHSVRAVRHRGRYVLADHVSRSFETWCLQWLRTTSASGATKFGNWWGNAANEFRRTKERSSEEIDAVGSLRNTVVVVAEARWRAARLGSEIIGDLEQYKIPALRQHVKVAARPDVVLFISAEDTETAVRTFAMMGDAFDEDRAPLSPAYVSTLLSNRDFWAFTALRGGEVVGGLTAHTLAMTRTESSEVFVYDIAVHAAHRRNGVGKLLIAALRAAARLAGIDVVFVPADDDDDDAIEFYRSLGPDESRVRFFVWE
jgi:aminoglycoside 3-N-acetyltransferase I